MDRALGLLMCLAMEGDAGLRLKDIAQVASLDPSTTHRLLASLKRFGLVDQDRMSRRYVLGMDFFTVAAAAAHRFQVSEAIRPHLRDLSERTDARSLFLVRSGLDLVCVDIQSSRARSSCRRDLGRRIPIGAGAAGIAVMAAMTDQEIEVVALRTVRQLDIEPDSATRAIRNAILQTRLDGFALAADSSVGTLTLAMAICDAGRRPQAALAVNGPKSLFAGRRTAALVQVLADHARQVEESFARDHALQTTIRLEA